MMAGRRWAVVFLAASLAACSLTATQPISYLQLRSSERPPATGDNPAVEVDAVQLPDYLLRDELLRRRGDYTLHYDPYQRWAEPLDLGIQRVIADNLEGLLGTREVARFPRARSRDADWRLSIEVRQFELDGDRVRLRASGLWRGVDRDTPTRSSAVEFEGSRPLASTETAEAARIAALLSELLEEFAATLANALTDARKGTDTSP
jgi:uncharacterized lipoprotein YmbA